MTEAVAATAGTWHDQAPAVATEAAGPGRLRLDDADPDRALLDTLAERACRMIDQRLELRPVLGRYGYQVAPQFYVVTYGTGEAPPDVVEAAVQLTMELYRRKDAPFGVLNAWSPSGEPLRIGRDVLAGVESLLGPHIEGWGLA
jgi:hypothetical protein